VNNVAALLDGDMYMESDDELIGGTRALRERRANRLDNARRLVRGDENPEDVEESVNDESFKDNEEMSHAVSINNDYDEDDDFASAQSEEKTQRMISQSPIRRENYHLG